VQRLAGKRQEEAGRPGFLLFSKVSPAQTLQTLRRSLFAAAFVKMLYESVQQLQAKPPVGA
jgi:hypothetical protein